MPSWRSSLGALGAAGLALVLGEAAHGALAVSGASIARTGVPARSVPACVACHGAAGEGSTAQQAPRLAHQNADYLAAQLAAFASGARQSAVMAPVAKALDADQRRAAAAYFASLPVPAATPGTPATGGSGRGAWLASHGDWAVKVPPCAACHGSKGQGVGAVVPPIAGQPAGYLNQQLANFRSGSRQGDALGLMRGVAQRLSTADLAAAAAYYASLPAPGANRGAGS